MHPLLKKILDPPLVFDSLSSVDINDGNTLASLTGYALYDVWHHLIGKPPYMKTISWRFQKKLHSGDRFRKPALIVRKTSFTCGGKS